MTGRLPPTVRLRFRAGKLPLDGVVAAATTTWQVSRRPRRRGLGLIHSVGALQANRRAAVF